MKEVFYQLVNKASKFNDVQFITYDDLWSNK